MKRNASKRVEALFLNLNVRGEEQEFEIANKKKNFDTSMKVVSMDSYGPKLISDTLFFCIGWSNKKCAQKNCQN